MKKAHSREQKGDNSYTMIKMGIIGFGFMGKVYAHAHKTIKSHYSGKFHDMEIKTVATASHETANKIDKDRYGIKYSTDNYLDIINDDEINAVYIASPNNFHYQQIVDCIDNGKNVLCDKPLATNSKDTKKLVDLCNNNKNLALQVVLEYRKYASH